MYITFIQIMCVFLFMMFVKDMKNHKNKGFFKVKVWLLTKEQDKIMWFKHKN
jgi:hypothetical protein